MKIFVSACLIISILGLSESDCPRGGFGNSQPQFGPRCMYKCHCVGDVQCDSVTGECPRGCAAGWMGPGCQYGDIAYNKQIQQSLNGSNMLIDGRNATDGLPTTCVGPTTWVVIDLNATYRISGLVINSSDAMRFHGYEVRVGNYSSDPPSDIVHTCFKQTVTQQLNTSTDVLCTNEVVGRYLLIRTPDNATRMTLCDVRVYGGRSLAYQHNASQSTTINTDFGIAVASRALDGNIDTSFHSSSCTHTDVELSPWWRVNLEVVYNIARIVLYGRSDCCSERLSGFSVSFATNSSFSLVFKYQNKTPPIITEVTTLSEDYAQHVQISLIDKTDALGLCEIFVFGDCQDNVCGWTCDIYCYCEGPINKQNIIHANCPGGCKTGWWGYSCNNTCDSNCKGNTCNQSDGYCLECSLGKWGHICENKCINCLIGTGCSASDGICTVGCLTGFYGVNCSEHCGECAGDGSCNRSTGACFECTRGKWGHLCQNNCTNCLAGTECGTSNGTCSVGCLTGLFGVRCGEHCGQCAADGSCTRSTGVCIHGCQPGWQEENCTIACPLGWYGINCSDICGHCANKTCDHINGTCPLGCFEGYNGAKCIERVQEEILSTESSSSLPVGAPVGGALGAVGLIVIISLAIIVARRRKRVPKTSKIESTYDQIDTTRVRPDISSEYSKLEDLVHPPVIPKENTYENTLSAKNLISKCQFRDIYQHYISLDDTTGELRLLSLFKSIGDDLTKTEVIRTAEDHTEISSKSYLFKATGKMEFTILSDFTTSSEAFWRIALERKVHLIIIIGENRIHFKPNVQVEIGLIQIECVGIAIERNLLLCNLNITGTEKKAKVKNVQVILSAEECGFCIPSNIDKTVAVLKERLRMRQGIEAFNTLVNCTPDAKDGECFVASLLMLDFMERSGNIDIMGIIEAMRKEKRDVIDTFDKFKFCHDVIFNWIVEEEKKRQMGAVTAISSIADAKYVLE